MLKSQAFPLGGEDAGRTVALTELPALVADRAARAALRACGAPPDGGVVALALEHSGAVRALGEPALALLQPFVGDFDLLQLKDWRNVERVQTAALYLHVSFLLGRETLDIPAAMQAHALFAGARDVRAKFCAPAIAAVLDSRLATYRELETVLSTEDVYNLVELVNVDAIRAWQAQQDKRD